MKKTALMVCAVFVGAAIFINFAGTLKKQRQSSLRLESKISLKKLSVSVHLYKKLYNEIPEDLEQLESVGLISKLSNFKQFDYVGNQGEVLAFRKQKFEKVKIGELWGGNGEVSKYEIPSARLLLFKNGSVKLIDEKKFQKKYHHLISRNSNATTKNVDSIKLLNLAIEELILGMKWNEWYTKFSGYTPDSVYFGAYITLPVENDLYIGLGTGLPSLGEGAMVAKFDGIHISSIGTLTEEGIHEMIWDSQRRILHIAGTDPWPDDWTAGNHYRYDPSANKKIEKHRDKENGLKNVIHTWGLCLAGNQVLWAAVNSHDGSFERDKNFMRKIFHRINSIIDSSYYSIDYGVTRAGQIFKSEDGGLNWKLVSNLGYFRAYDIIEFNNVLYAIYADKPEMPCRLAKSDDKGMTWQDISQCQVQNVHLTPFKNKLLCVSDNGKSIYSMVSGKLEKYDLPVGYEIKSRYNFNLLTTGKHFLYILCTQQDGASAIIRTADFRFWERVSATDDKLISLSYWKEKNWLIAGSQGLETQIFKVDLNQQFTEINALSESYIVNQRERRIFD
jgi:hypothetical protein